MLTPLKPAGAVTRVVLGVGFFILFLALWAAVTHGGIVDPQFLASPLAALRAGIDLFANFSFHIDVGLTVWRVLGGLRRGRRHRHRGEEQQRDRQAGDPAHSVH